MFSGTSLLGCEWSLSQGGFSESPSLWDLHLSLCALPLTETDRTIRPNSKTDCISGASLNYLEKWSAKFTSNVLLEMKTVFYFLKMQWLFNMDIIVFTDHTANGPSLRSVICFVFLHHFLNSVLMAIWHQKSTNRSKFPILKSQVLVCYIWKFEVTMATLNIMISIRNSLGFKGLSRNLRHLINMFINAGTHTLAHRQSKTEDSLNQFDSC